MSLNYLQELCIKCATEHFYLPVGYFILVCVLWFITNYDNGLKKSRITERMMPQQPSDLPHISIKRILVSVSKNMVEYFNNILNFFKIKNLFWIVTSLIKIFEFLYGVRGNRWDYLRSFKAALIFYLVIIPIPATFLPPVSGQQITPNADLAIAVGLLILINSIGDMFSVNFTVRVFKSAVKNYNNELSYLSIKGKKLFQIRTKSEFAKEFVFYITILLDMLFAILCLVIVLMCSSVLYGIQIGEFAFNYDRQTLSLMWQSAIDFWRLSGKLYWYTDDPTAFLGQAGIPGMLFFSMTTFLPTLFIGFAAILWLLVLPIRIVLVKRKQKGVWLLVSQSLAGVVCLFLAGIQSIDINRAYALLITT